MAIDDDTKYGLTGAQVKDLVARIKAGGGDAVKVLTTADYNYPTSNPTTVALWLLEPGMYMKDDNNVQVNKTAGVALAYGSIAIVCGKPTDSRRLILDIENNYNGLLRQTFVYTNDGSLQSDIMFVRRRDIIDSLTSTATDSPLSAKQGKVLKELIDDLGTDKQDVLTAGTNITIDANNVISATGGGTSYATITEGTDTSGDTIHYTDIRRETSSGEAMAVIREEYNEDENDVALEAIVHKDSGGGYESTNGLHVGEHMVYITNSGTGDSGSWFSNIVADSDYLDASSKIDDFKAELRLSNQSKMAYMRAGDDDNTSSVTTEIGETSASTSITSAVTDGAGASILNIESNSGHSMLDYVGKNDDESLEASLYVDAYEEDGKSRTNIRNVSGHNTSYLSSRAYADSVGYCDFDIETEHDTGGKSRSEVSVHSGDGNSSIFFEVSSKSENTSSETATVSIGTLSTDEDGFLASINIQNIDSIKYGSDEYAPETWTFTLSDNSTVTKKIFVA